MHHSDNQYESFSHGLVVSKIWLCDELEKIIVQENIDNPKLNILACWDNLLSFMLLTRKPNGYKEINAYDLDTIAIDSANKITDTWRFEYSKINNHVADINQIAYNDKDAIYINCSIDQMEENTWYDNIPINSLICFQSTDVTSDDNRWHITQHISSLDNLISKYKLTKLLYSGIKNINYGPWEYNRFMIIGYK
jgi:hypothetical protein